MTDVLKDAGVAASTWTRMQTGGPYLSETLAKITAALDALINEGPQHGREG